MQSCQHPFFHQPFFLSNISFPIMLLFPPSLFHPSCQYSSYIDLFLLSFIPASVIEPPPSPLHRSITFLWQLLLLFALHIPFFLPHLSSLCVGFVFLRLSVTSFFHFSCPCFVSLWNINSSNCLSPAFLTVISVCLSHRTSVIIAWHRHYYYNCFWLFHTECTFPYIPLFFFLHFCLSVHSLFILPLVSCFSIHVCSRRQFCLINVRATGRKMQWYIQ